MMISLIAAMDEKRGIGRNNDLLFRISDDFKRMKQLTSGHPIIMGRKTFESIGRALPNRTNIIITHSASFARRGLPKHDVVVVYSLEEAIERAKKSLGADEIFIFGGGQIFQQALEQNLVNKLYLTIVEGNYHADTFFPDYSMFKIVKKEERESEGYKYTFLELEKDG